MKFQYLYSNILKDKYAAWTNLHSTIFQKISFTKKIYLTTVDTIKTPSEFVKNKVRQENILTDMQVFVNMYYCIVHVTCAILK